MKKIANSILAVIGLVALNVSCVKQIVAVTGVTLSPESIELIVGDQKILTATVTPDDAANKIVSFSSSKESVATVSQDGIIDARAAGEAIVTVTTGDGGHIAHCTVKVVESREVVTGAATQISCRNAKLAGTASVPSSMSTSFTLGILYSTSPDVPEGSATRTEARYFDSEYNYSISTDVLEPETTYYYRAYLSLSGEVYYGDVKSFKTLAASNLIQTLDVTDINQKDAVLNASLNLVGCTYDEIEYGFEVTPEGEDAYTLNADNYSKAEKTFSIKDESLQQDKKYSVVAYVKLDGRKYDGGTKNFSTRQIQATVTAESSNIKHKSATISGKLTVESTSLVTKSATLYYGTAASTLEDLKSTGKERTLTLSSADGSFSIDLSLLAPGSEYNYVVIAKVDDFEFNTGVKSFSTLPLESSLAAEASNVSYRSATISGKLTVKSEEEFTKSAALYYSTTASTLEELISGGTRTSLRLDADGSFSTDPSPLASNTQYNYVVIAKVDDFDLNTGVKSFKTLQIKASLSAEASNVKCKSATVSGKLNIESDGSLTKSATLYYSTMAGTLDELKSSGTELQLALDSDGSYSVDLSSLAYDTQYNYVAIAKVEDIDLNTEVKSFKTLPLEASITIGDPETKCTSAKVTGQLTIKSEGTFEKSVTLYYSKTETQSEGLKSRGTKVPVTLASDDSFSVEIKYLDYDDAYYCTVVATVEDKEFASVDVKRCITLDYQVPKMVDLGLSVKWASFNVGAVSPEDFGGFYQWAGLNDVADPSIKIGLENCPYHNGDNAYSGWTKYMPSKFASYWGGSGGPDGKTTIELMDDVARQKLGGGWRIPTYAEWGELHTLSKCDWTWTEINGVGGYKVTSKIPGYTNNWIFLPAAGYRSGSGHYEAGTQGHYGSSTLESQFSPFASCYLYFYNGGVLDGFPGRPEGLTIRAVSR